MLELIRVDLRGLSARRINFEARAPVFAGDAVDLSGSQGSGDLVGLAAGHVGASRSEPAMKIECATTLEPEQALAGPADGSSMVPGGPEVPGP
jgi:hypothetical protein